MADAAKRVVLAGQDAIDLWQQGADAWNAWVAENPVADVDFSGVDFTKYGGVSFAEFRFPNGKKDFSETVFGDGDISFRHTKFGEGNIVFFHANFSEGNVSFRGARWTRAMSNSGQRHLGWGISISNMPIWKKGHSFLIK